MDIHKHLSTKQKQTSATGYIYYFNNKTYIKTMFPIFF